MMLLVLLVLGSAFSQEIFIPFLYVTPSPIYGPAGSTNTFYVPLCSNPAYEGYTLEISFNLPFAAWNETAQVAVAAQVYNTSDQTGTPIADNGSPGQEQPVFSFQYKASFGDLWIKTRNGNSPNIIYTLSAEFALKTGQKVPEYKREVRPRVQHHRRPIVGTSKTQATYTLTQIIADTTQYQVATGESILINFDYCPTTEAYNIVISVVAVDDASASALYVCTNSTQFPCTPASASPANTDPRGIAVSQVILTTKNEDLTSLQANIVGWGRYNYKNTFLFSVNVQ